MNLITGAALVGVSVALAIRYRPKRYSVCGKILAFAVALGLFSMASPLSGVFRWIGLGLQLLTGICCFVSVREYKIHRRMQRHREAIQQSHEAEVSDLLRFSRFQ